MNLKMTYDLRNAEKVLPEFIWQQSYAI